METWMKFAEIQNVQQNRKIQTMMNITYMKFRKKTCKTPEKPQCVSIFFKVW